MNRNSNPLLEALIADEDSVAITALTVYSMAFQQWCESVLPSAMPEFEKVKELATIAERPLAASLGQVDRRLLFGILRDLPLRWIAKVTGSDESPMTMQLIRTATKSVLSHAASGQFQVRETRPGTTALFMTAQEADALMAQLPFIMGGLLGTSIAQMESYNASRVVAQGAKIEEQSPPFPSLRAMLSDRLIAKEAPRVRLGLGQELEASLRSIFGRKEALETSSISGLQVGFETEQDFEGWRWWSLGIPTLHGRWPVRHDLWISQAEVGLLQTSYVIQPVGLQPIVRELELFEARFADTLGISFADLEWFTEGLSRLVTLHSGVYAISESIEVSELHSRSVIDPQRMVDEPGTFLKDAQDVWNRGAICNSRTWFIETLFGVLDGEHDRDAIDRLIKKFTSAGDLRNWFQPWTFYEMNSDMIVLDLFEFADFHERVVSVVSATIPGHGDLRGDVFERRCTQRILDQVGLTLSDPRVIRSYQMRFRERNYGDVDLAVVSRDVLINVDMKSRQLDFKYFHGGPEAVRNRQSSLVRALEDKVTVRGEKLATVLNDAQLAKSRGLSPANIAATFSFLCVASPEFLSREEPALWYGDVPRVLTPSELASLIKDPSPLKLSTAQDG